MSAIRSVTFPEKYYASLRSPGAILLQTSRIDAENYRSFLFLHPVRRLILQHHQELPQLFTEIQKALDEGNYVSGYLSYEAGEYFEHHGSPSFRKGRVPLASFNVYAHAYVFNHLTGCFEGNIHPPEPEGEDADDLLLDQVELNIRQDDYSIRIDAIKEWIRSGDTYQVNLTDKVKFRFSGSPLGLYRQLLSRQEVSYTAYLNLGDLQILSFSPELFFRVRGNQIHTRPMKGTVARGRDVEEDKVSSDWLRHDEKNRAENLMIVDLLRNDLGRICEFGSVTVDDLFAIERYETLFQMTSGISGKLRNGVKYWDIFRSLFPCGSITGAPKVRTMEIIRELEPEPRGVYTGAIGFFSPYSEAAFNVAIRTVTLSGNQGEMGVGGGIVYDSDAVQEYRECLLKAAFLSESRPAFQLIETMLWSGNYQRLDYHMRRLKASCEYFAFLWDEKTITEELSRYASFFEVEKSYRVRLLLEKSGAVHLSSTVMEQEDKVFRVAIAPERTSSSDPFFRHKTTNRSLYDRWRSRALQGGFDEVLFLNECNQITEGAITNIFIDINGRLFTPPVSSGLLPGVYRRFLLDSNSRAEEKVLTMEDLYSAQAIYLCNSVRGLRRAEIHFSAVI